MYKLMAIDLDDTLLTDELTISERDKKNLEKIYKAGVKVVICSGRSDKSMIRVMKQLNFLKGKDFYIAYNGSMIRNLDGDYLFEDSLSKEVLATLIDLGREYQVAIQCYHHGLVVEKYDEVIRSYEMRVGSQAKIIEDLKQLPSSIKLLFNSPERQRLESLQKAVEQHFNQTVHVFFSKPEYLEVVNINSNKGLAVKQVADMLNIEQKEVICIGDGFNDGYMIDYAGLGVAVANAHPEVKKKANYVTRCDHNNSAVSEVIDQYIKLAN